MKINYHAPINQTGYGVASFNILKALLQKQINISYFPIHNPSVTSQEDYDLIVHLIRMNSHLDPKAPCVKIWHQFDLASRIGNGEYIAYPFFELDSFNTLEKNHLNIPDKLIASSKWAQQVYQMNGCNKPSSVVPLGVDLSIFNHNTITKTRQDDKYVFLSIGKWEVRKGHDLLPQIFTQAFPDAKDVELWILASENISSYSSAEEIVNWKNKYKIDDRIKIMPEVPTHKDIAQLIANSDCGLYVSRAEGWNLELLETMAMNKPAIATNYSAHTEFCNKENSYLIDIESIEPAYDGKAFKGQGNWAKIGQNQIDQTIEHMRYLYSNRINTNTNGVETANKYSWQNSADHLLRCIMN